MNVVNKFLDLNIKPKIHVIGDCLVDEYYYVSANRISPEFPIPIMHSNSLNSCLAMPGGAANTVFQFKYFNVDVSLFGFIDPYARKVFENSSISTKNCVEIPSNIPLKKRLYHGDFPLCRWDIEKSDYGLNNEQLEHFQRSLYIKYQESSEPDIVIYSDYNKGVFSEFGLGKKIWFEHSDPISIIDPKHGPVSNWKGCTIFKPNSLEAEKLSNGIKDWKKQCDYFQQETDCVAVIITCGGDGVVGKLGKDYFEYRPTKGVIADSVIGAGDCFVAFLAMAIAKDMHIEEAVEIAFDAGSIYVQKRHNEPVAPYELAIQSDPIYAKYVKIKDLEKREDKLVVTNGCFDILHSGHLELLKYAKSLGDKLLVLINSDESISRLKGPNRPVISLKNRMELLASLQFVDYVIPFEEDTPKNILETIKPEVLVKGSEYKIEEIVGSDIIKEVYVFPMVEGLSTTNIINKIKQE